VEPERYAEVKMTASSGTGGCRDFEAGFFYGLVSQSRTSPACRLGGGGTKAIGELAMLSLQVWRARAWRGPVRSSRMADESRSTPEHCPTRTARDRSTRAKRLLHFALYLDKRVCLLKNRGVT